MVKKNSVNKTNRKLLFLLSALILTLVLFVFFAKVKNGQKFGLVAKPIINSKDINYYLDALDKERFTEESKRPIRKFIKEELQKYGYKVSEQNTGKFINLIADKGNIPEKYVLIGAHYDTVPDTTGIDDNASGVAALLAVAKYNQNHNVRIVAFDGEEYNFTGSRYYVKNTSPRPQLMVSLETMGYYSNEPNSQSIPAFYDWVYRGLYNRLKSNQFRGNFSTLVCTHNADSFCNKYESYASSLNLEVYTVYIPIIPVIKNFFIDLFRSDHTPFLLAGVPSVMVTDSANFRTPNYHKPTDTRETVSADFIAKQANAILAILSAISDK